MGPQFTCVFLASYSDRKHAVAVNSKPDLAVTDKPVSLGMVGEIMDHHQALDPGHVRGQSFLIDLSSVDSPYFNHPVRVTGGQMVRGTIQVNKEA